MQARDCDLGVLRWETTGGDFLLMSRNKAKHPCFISFDVQNEIASLGTMMMTLKINSSFCYAHSWIQCRNHHYWIFKERQKETSAKLDRANQKDKIWVKALRKYIYILYMYLFHIHYNCMDLQIVHTLLFNETTSYSWVWWDFKFYHQLLMVHSIDVFLSLSSINWF